MTPQEDDVVLVLLAQSGDTAAFEKLLRSMHADPGDGDCVPVCLLPRRACAGSPMPFTVIMVLGLMLVAVTIKLAGLTNRNSRVLLRVIAEINRE